MFLVMSQPGQRKIENASMLDKLSAMDTCTLLSVNFSLLSFFCIYFTFNLPFLLQFIKLFVYKRRLINTQPLAKFIINPNPLI